MTPTLRTFGPFFFLILSFFIAAPAAAQEIHWHSQMSPRQDQTAPYTPLQYPAATTPETPQEEADRLAACKRMLMSDNKPFSFKGYWHNRAHCLGWVKQLQQSTGADCCSSPYDGECRVSKIDPITRLVELDGMWCPVTNGTKWGAVIGLKIGLVLVCASDVSFDKEGKPLCPTTYCIGGETGS